MTAGYQDTHVPSSSTPNSVYAQRDEEDAGSRNAPLGRCGGTSGETGRANRGGTGLRQTGASVDDNAISRGDTR